MMGGCPTGRPPPCSRSWSWWRARAAGRRTPWGAADAASPTVAARLAERASVQRAEELVRRYGAPAVTLSFLTVGVQTAVNLAAGTLRMPLPRYLPALLLGALVWATIYLTVGLAVLEALVGGRSGLLLLAAVVAVVVVLAVSGLVRRRE
jgi:membrane protein DedA with SNARE-associated domain